MTSKLNDAETCREVLRAIAECCDATALARADGYLFRYVKEETVLRDCGQHGVCRTPPGCARHWEERNRELAGEVQRLTARVAIQSKANEQLGLLFNERSVLWSDATSKLDAVRGLLESNGCDCDCGHHFEEHDDDCELCLACRVNSAVT